LESVHIWRLGIHSLTVYRARLYGDDLRDVPLINREQAKLALIVQARGPGRPPLTAVLLSGKAEIEPCFSAGHEQSQCRRGTSAARVSMPGRAPMHSK
jgi:hypothetical protein